MTFPRPPLGDSDHLHHHLSTRFDPLPTDPLPSILAPRRRPKVSCACDECRRKKIKCDGARPCANCVRAAALCQSTRVQQKRGPSKGYIRELAERIDSIEDKLDTNSEAGRKRPFTHISTDPQWVAPRLADTPAADSFQLSNTHLPEDLAFIAAHGLQLDPTLFQKHMSTVYPMFPFLGTSPAAISNLLVSSPRILGVAFLEAFSLLFSSGSADLAHRLIASPDAARAAQSGDVLYLFTLLALAIHDADPLVHTGQKDSLAYLGRAVTAAVQRRYYHLKPGEESRVGDGHRVRIWWTLVVLDRWSAVAGGTAPLVPDRTVFLPTGLLEAVGPTAYYLIRLSKILNLASTCALTPAPWTVLSVVLRDMIDDWQLTLPELPLVRLAYWHARILVSIVAGSPANVADACTHSSALLVAHTSPMAAGSAAEHDGLDPERPIHDVPLLQRHCTALTLAALAPGPEAQRLLDSAAAADWDAGVWTRARQAWAGADVEATRGSETSGTNGATGIHDSNSGDAGAGTIAPLTNLAALAAAAHSEPQEPSHEILREGYMAVFARRLAGAT